MTRDFSHVLYLHYSFLAYDSIKTIMSMIIIELIITTILIMITIVIYWNVIGVLAVYFHKSFCTVVIGQIHLGQISPVETMPGEKKSSIMETTHFFFRMSGCCYGYCDQLCKCSASICIAKKNFVPSVFAFFQSIIRDR